MAARKIKITFGLLTIEARRESATQSAATMSNLCQGQPGKAAHDPLPVKAPRRCDGCGEITDPSALVKGVKSGSTYTIVDSEELATAKEEYAGQHKGEIKLVPHPASDFLTATAPGDKLDFITPEDAGGADRYQLMVRLVASHPELAFAGLFTPMSKTDLWMLQVRDGVLVMQNRVREQAIKAAPSVGGEVNEALYAMLDGSLDQFVVPYDPEAYEDRYAVAVAAMVAKGEQVSVDRAEVATSVQMSDDELMAKLAKLQEVA